MLFRPLISSKSSPSLHPPNSTPSLKKRKSHQKTEKKIYKQKISKTKKHPNKAN